MKSRSASIDEEIKRYEQLIKDNEMYIKCNDEYNFSQLRWKKENCKYKQIIEQLKERKKKC